MVVKSYNFESEQVEALVEIRHDLYNGDAEETLQTAEIRRQLGPDFPVHLKQGNDHKGFVVLRDGKPVGHVSAIVNREMVSPDDTPVGVVGFFECIKDYTVAEELLHAAVQWLRDDKQLTRIWGPIQFDIWHGYRFKTRGFNIKPFSGEPSNKSYYPHYFEKFGFKPGWQWNSVWLADLIAADNVIVHGESERNRMIDMGFRFTNLETRADFPLLHTSLMEAFKDLPGFTPVSFDEFEKQFLAQCQDLRLVTLVRDTNKRVSAFAVAYPNTHVGLNSIPGSKTAVFRLIGTVGKRSTKDQMLAHSTVYHTVRQCFHAGYDSVVLAMMRKSVWSEVLKIKRLDDALSSYVLYELEV